MPDQTLTLVLPGAKQLSLQENGPDGYVSLCMTRPAPAPKFLGASYDDGVGSQYTRVRTLAWAVDDVRGGPVDHFDLLRNGVSVVQPDYLPPDKMFLAGVYLEEFQTGEQVTIVAVGPGGSDTRSFTV
jgi:hypothetical protein